MRFKRVTAYITGGSRGIGAACVRKFTKEGWLAGFTYHARAKTAEALSNETHAVNICADVSDEKKLQSAFEAFGSAIGEADALICNAGISEQKQFQDITDEGWHNMLGVNFMGAVHAIRAVLPGMLRRKNGSIVLVSSIWGERGASCESHYAASKAALIGLGKSLAMELGPSGIRVNCVAPGVIDTEMNAIHSGETLRNLAGETPLCRLGEASEVADSIFYLCSGSASFITGQVLSVSGGF